MKSTRVLLLLCAFGVSAGVVVLQVDPSAGGSKCGSDGRCPTLAAALAQATALTNASTTVRFSGAQRVAPGAPPFQLRSAPAPASLRLEGVGDGAAIDGGGVSALLSINGGGAVTIANVAFTNGYHNITAGDPRTAPVTVGAGMSALPLPTRFENCAFRDNRGLNGGAVFLFHGSTAFENCSFEGNTAYGGGDGGVHDTGGGGAIFVDHGEAELIGCRFARCVAADPPSVAPGTTGGHHGGAIMNVEGTVRSESSEYVACSSYQGGALYTWMWGTMLVSKSTFINNSAAGHHGQTGGAIFTDRGILQVLGSHFEGNTANASGGAMYAWSAQGAHGDGTQNVTVADSSFVRNTALHGSGGAIGNWHSSMHIARSLFDGNTAGETGGAVWNDAYSSVSIAATNFTAANSAPAQGACVYDNKQGTVNLTEHCRFITPTPAAADAKGAFFQCTVLPGGLDVVSSVQH